MTDSLALARTGFDPAPDLLALSARDGLTRVTTPFGTEAWLVTRYADVREVLADPARFSNTGPVQGFEGSQDQARAVTTGNLLTYDPPEHTRLRKMLGGVFTVRRVERLRARVEEIVTDRLDAMAAAGPPHDLVAGFALPVPALVICELLGVPADEREDFLRHSVDGLDTSAPEAERLAVMGQVHQHMATLVARARAEPGDDLLGKLARDGGEDLGDAEMTGLAMLLLAAGHETTSAMLGIGTLALLRHRDQLAVLRDGDPAEVAPAVEELLRWLSVVQTGLQRTASADTELAGTRVAAGDTVLLSLAAANRDPALVERPEALDVTRPATSHVAFGHGVHHCIGAPLARLEMQVAFPALLRRFPDLALAVPDEQVSYLDRHLVYGVRSLPVTW